MELESKREDYLSQGIEVAAVSYDAVEVLRTYSERVDISYPLLADPDLTVIRAFDLLNPSVPEDSPFFGFALAG